MDQFKQFGRRIRAVRKAAKLTQEEVAEKAGIAPNFLGYLERGTKRPSLEVVFALAKALGVSADSFFRSDHSELDEKVLRKRIHALVEKFDHKDLRSIYNFIAYVIGP